MTRPDKTYWDRRYASTAPLSRPRPRPSSPGRSALGGHHQVAGLELRRVDDLGLGEGLVLPGVLQEEHGRGPLLPVRAFAPRECDRAVPADELGAEEGFHDVVGLVALRRVDGVRQQHHLGIRVEAAIHGLLLELLEVARPEGLAPRRQL